LQAIYFLTRTGGFDPKAPPALLKSSGRSTQ
jgi:hypothetical protein